MNGLLDVVAKVSSLYRSSPFCRKVLGDHIRGEGVGFPIVFSDAVVKLGGEQ